MLLHRSCVAVVCHFSLTEHPEYHFIRSLLKKNENPTLQIWLNISIITADFQHARGTCEESTHSTQID